MHAVLPRASRGYQFPRPRVERPNLWLPPVRPARHRPTLLAPAPVARDVRPRPSYHPYVGPPKAVHQGRLTFLAVLWVVFAGVVLVRLVDLQVVRRSEFAAKATGQQERHVVIDARRGRIVDRNGNDLAVSLNAASVAINPRRVKQPGALARRISAITEEPVDRIYRRIGQRTKAFAWVARNVEPEDARRLVNLEPDAMWILGGTKRAHPFGGLAGQALGHVDVDNVGGDGLELSYDAKLSGQDGWMTSLVDAFGERVPNTAQPYVAPHDGASLSVTLDADFQAIVEHELAVGVEQTEAESGFAVLYDASTGAIRAMANVPTFNPDLYAQYADPAKRRNRVITDPYEPGSMFKVIAASAALAERKVTAGEIINCENGRIQIAGQTIRDSHPNGRITFREVIAQSSNIGTIKVAMRLRAETFYKYMRLFGLGAEVGIDLPGESRGILGKRSTWSARSQATIAIGQEISVTALQMAAAYGALANDGWLMRPYLVEKLVAPSGQLIQSVKPVRVRQVIPAAVADEMVELLCGVVEEGTGTSARIAGLRVAGKTGTAQVARADGRGYEPGAYIASFVGFLPETSPRLVCVVSVRKPRTVHYGSAVAAPVFKRIMSRVVSRDAALLMPSVGTVGPQMPNVTGLDRLDATMRLDGFGVPVRVVGKGTVVIGQWPPASALVPADKPVELVVADRAGSGRVVPDVRGMTFRQAIATLAGAELNARLEGSGVVVSQDPGPGSRMQRHVPVSLRGEQAGFPRLMRRSG